MPGPLTLDDFNRRFSILDQMLTMHSVERDRYRRWSTALTLLVLGLSIVATMVALISGERHVDFGSFKATVQTAVGILTAIIFFLTLVDLRVDWRERARGHQEAADKLAELKAQFRGATTQNNTVTGNGVDLALEYDQVMEAIVPITERRFLRLKAKHKRKVAISRLLDRRPHAPVWWLRICLMLKDLRCGDRAPSSRGPAEAQDVQRQAQPVPQDDTPGTGAQGRGDAARPQDDRGGSGRAEG
jgi:hypothetical protein